MVWRRFLSLEICSVHKTMNGTALTRLRLVKLGLSPQRSNRQNVQSHGLRLLGPGSRLIGDVDFADRHLYGFRVNLNLRIASSARTTPSAESLRSRWSFHEQLLKSISATFVMVAGRAFKGCAVASFVVVCSDGMQSGAPPLRGRAASASTAKSTSPVVGTE